MTQPVIADGTDTASATTIPTLPQAPALPTAEALDAEADIRAGTRHGDGNGDSTQHVSTSAADVTGNSNSDETANVSTSAADVPSMKQAVSSSGSGSASSAAEPSTPVEARQQLQRGPANSPVVPGPSPRPLDTTDVMLAAIGVADDIDEEESQHAAAAALAEADEEAEDEAEEDDVIMSEQPKTVENSSTAAAAAAARGGASASSSAADAQAEARAQRQRLWSAPLFPNAVRRQQRAQQRANGQGAKAFQPRRALEDSAFDVIIDPPPPSPPAYPVTVPPAPAPAHAAASPAAVVPAHAPPITHKAIARRMILNHGLPIVLGVFGGNWLWDHAPDLMQQYMAMVHQQAPVPAAAAAAYAAAAGAVGSVAGAEAGAGGPLLAAGGGPPALGLIVNATGGAGNVGALPLQPAALPRSLLQVNDSRLPISPDKPGDSDTDPMKAINRDGRAPTTPPQQQLALLPIKPEASPTSAAATSLTGTGASSQGNALSSSPRATNVSTNSSATGAAAANATGSDDATAMTSMLRFRPAAGGIWGSADAGQLTGEAQQSSAPVVL